jgi:hypothetical protein
MTRSVEIGPCLCLKNPTTRAGCILVGQFPGFTRPLGEGTVLTRVGGCLQGKSDSGASMDTSQATQLFI